jgi:hypothetical protein
MLLLEQLPPSLALGVGPALDLVPHCFGALGIYLPLRHNPLEVQPLGGLEQVASPPLNREHLREHSYGRRHQAG